MPNIIIYSGGVLATNYQPLMNSGFTTVILNSLHVHPDGSLWMNDTEFVDPNGTVTTAAQTMAAAVSDLKTSGGVSTVLVSIGGGGSFPPDPNGINGVHSVSDSDFLALNAVYWAATGMTSPLSNSIPLLGSLAALLDALGADGIDLDPEPIFYTYETLASATILLSEWAFAQGKMVTWVPFEARGSWAAMASLFFEGTGRSLSWVNLQPSALIVDTLEQWAESFGVGVGSMVVGFAGDPPSSIQSQLAQLINSGTVPGGAYFWNYDQIANDNPAEYAKAMIAGLNGEK